MPSNPLRKILDRRAGGAGKSSEEALEKLEREIRESREAVRHRNEEIARGFFGDSIESLKRQVAESRATLEGLPEQLPSGDEESFRSFVGELTEAYARIEEALDEAAENAPGGAGEEGFEGPDESDTDGHEAEEPRPDDDAAGDEALAAVEGLGETAGDAAESVVGVAEQAVGGEPDEDDAPKASDAARRRAEDLGVDLSEVEGTGSAGAITVRDVNKLAESLGEGAEDASDRASEGVSDASEGAVENFGLAGRDGRTAEADEGGEGNEGAEDEPRATNAARRRAEELGVDLKGIEGSGANGLITIQDVVKL